MNLITRLFGKGEASLEILCPHCERAMEPGHRCAAMSRRFFFGVMAGAAAALSVPSALVVEGSFNGFWKIDEPVVSHNWGLSQSFSVFLKVEHVGPPFKGPNDRIVLWPNRMVVKNR